MNININKSFGTHNTSKRTGKIEYIVIHYVGATGDAKANVDYHNKKSTTNASADFFVGHNGDVWQYNTDLEGRYCWAVGGGKKSPYGGSLYGIAKNANCINIEMCVLNETSDRSANSRGWNLTLATRNATVELTKYLMEKFGIDANHVIRHLDVNGKVCPGLQGWNTVGGNKEDAWMRFKRDISNNQVANVTVTSKKSVDEIAKEVIAGEWGNGTDRRQRLESAGYEYKAIQKRVNELL